MDMYTNLDMPLLSMSSLVLMHESQSKTTPSQAASRFRNGNSIRSRCCFSSGTSSFNIR